MASPNIAATVKANPIATAVVVLLVALGIVSWRIESRLDTITPCVCPGMAQPQ